MRNRRRLGAAIAGIVLVATGLAAAVTAATERIAPDVRVGSIDVSNMTLDRAEVELERERAALATRSVTVRVDDKRWTATYADLGVSLDVAGTVTRAFGVGRPDNGTIDFRTWFGGFGTPRVVEASLQYTGSALDTFAMRIANETEQQPVEGSVELTNTGIVEHAAAPGARVTRDEVRAAILSSSDLDHDLTLQRSTVAPSISATAIHEAAEQARALARPVLLTSAAGAVALPADRMLALVRVTRGIDVRGDRLNVHADAAALAAIISEIAARFDRTPQNAELIGGNERFQVVPGKNGVAIDRVLLAALIEAPTQQISDGQRIIAVPITEIAPELTTEQAQLIARETTRLGTFTTYFPPDYARETNIGAAARRFDGMVIKPGETFSFWDRIGVVSAATGYVNAGAIINGKSEEAIGGGLCQVSTTMFNAVMLAGYQIDERHAHAYYIERYPVGRDAAVFLGYQDFRWTNDTAASVYLLATSTNSSVTFWTYGAPTGRTVDLTPPAQWNFVSPAPNQPADPHHPPGYTVLGRSVNEIRTVRVGEAVVHKDSWFSYYAPVWGGPLEPQPVP